MNQNQKGVVTYREVKISLIKLRVTLTNQKIQFWEICCFVWIKTARSIRFDTSPIFSFIPRMGAAGGCLEYIRIEMKTVCFSFILVSVLFGYERAGSHII